jgi:hypothetical protein
MVYSLEGGKFKEKGKAKPKFNNLGIEYCGERGTFRTWPSRRFVAKGHTLYCGLIRGPHVKREWLCT